MLLNITCSPHGFGWNLDHGIVEGLRKGNVITYVFGFFTSLPLKLFHTFFDPYISMHKLMIQTKPKVIFRWSMDTIDRSELSSDLPE